MKSSAKDTILLYIKLHFKPNEPIIQKYLYDVFDTIKPVTIRQSLLRLTDEGKIKKSDSIYGVFYLENPNRIFDMDSFDIKQYIEKRYLFDVKGEVVGYISGPTLENHLGLTSQVPVITYIYSNAVSEKRRSLLINNRKYLLSSAKVKVTNQNVKLLQVLDLISYKLNYEKNVFTKANLNVIFKYLNKVELDKDEIEMIVNQYPLETQLLFYKMEVDHAITSRPVCM